MKKFFQNLPFKIKLIIASAVPLIALFYYLQLSIKEELEHKESAQQTITIATQVEEYSRMLHEFQKERALTLNYLLEAARTDNKDLRLQQQATDREIASLKDVIGNNGSLSFLDSLFIVRKMVEQQKEDEHIDGYYYGIKNYLLNKITIILRTATDPGIKNLFEEHLFLLYTKDYLASVRTSLSKAFTLGKFEQGGFVNFAATEGKYEINLKRFLLVASPDLKKYFYKKYDVAEVQQTKRIIDSVFTNPAGSTATFKFSGWWDISTATINQIKDVEDYSITKVKRQAEQVLSDADAALKKNIFIAALTVILIILIVSSTIRAIVNSINLIKIAADRMARGDTGLSLDIKSHDEIESLADSFNRMISVTRNYSEAAEIIGKGDYSPVISVRSEKDILGSALNNMRNNLRSLQKKNEERTWLLTGNSSLNDIMRGEKEIHLLAADVIIHLAHYFEAQIGILYLYENGKLHPSGSYAFDAGKNVEPMQLGEGLVGQAAVERKPIILNEVPADYFKINSGSGSIAPKSLIIFPLVYETEITGVIELGSIRKFTDLQTQFLTMVGENIAIAFQSAQSRARLKLLLEETQRQAEELETQQEELKIFNDELQAKTELLEQSDEELRVQQEELQQTNEELEEKANMLEEQKETLENAKLEIENKARELEITSNYKSEFLSNMSHELRTPLNSILILAQILKENKNSLLGSKEILYAQNILNSGNDLLTLINEILDLSKIESGRMELDITEVPLTELSTDVNLMFAEIAQNKFIKFKINNNVNEIPVIKTDRLKLEQILRNLLSNAFKFTDKEGTVSLTIEKCRPGISFKNNRLQNKEVLAFTVSDTGVGIPQDKMDIIFEAFQQADSSTKRKYGGTGLGLSICRELSNVLGGEIHTSSEEGKGSTFMLYLPASFDRDCTIPINKHVDIKVKRKEWIEEQKAINGSSAGDTNDDRNNIRLNDKIVLIMEDDESFARVLLDFVRERRYKGIIARHENIGLNYARHYKPDAIILDMMLSGTDGSQILKQLKNDPTLRHIPVQIISMPEDSHKGLGLGAFDFINKPISRAELQKAFDKIESFVSKGTKKLLIVEDNKLQNNLIREIIGNGDVICVSAYSGSEAFELLQKEAFDCIIVDLGLPDMSGFELLDKIKNNETFGKTPVIVYTGRDLKKEESTVLNKLANTVVIKTVNSHERLLDETTLFLHRVESKLPAEKQSIIRKLHKTDEILKDKKVLIVDDDVRNVYSLTSVLEEEGIICIPAENGEVALAELKANPDICMVLMDVMMPVMDGYEAAREIRKIEEYKKLPVIALTAKAMKGDREKCLLAGMSDYITKPINTGQLLSLMRVWLYQ